MFAPTKTWRRWHRRVNVNQKRYALVSALAASAVPSLVMARGHAIEEVEEVPLVLSGVEDVQKTKDAVAALAAVGAADDVDKARASKKVRAGKGKMRGRRYVMRRGPLVVHADSLGLARAVRNLPGVDVCHVDRLNLLQLAPGGHLGRFVVWTQAAFDKLDELYGTYDGQASSKVGYSLPRPIMANADLARLINSSEVQKVVRPVKRSNRFGAVLKKNPLKNLGAMIKLNPYAMKHRRNELLAAERRAADKAAGIARSRATRNKASRARSAKFFDNMMSDEHTKPTSS